MCSSYDTLLVHTALNVVVLVCVQVYTKFASRALSTLRALFVPAAAEFGLPIERMFSNEDLRNGSVRYVIDALTSATEELLLLRVVDSGLVNAPSANLCVEA